MTKRKVLLFVLLLVALLIASRPEDLQAQEALPRKIDGVELRDLKPGWLPARYMWFYSKQRATVHPLPSLWTPERYQSPSEIREDCKALNEHGAVADVWQFNPYTPYSDYNYWLSVQGIPECDSRKFFLAYEHMGPAEYVSDDDGRKNMDLPVNRDIWMRNIDFLVRKVILPNQKRYVTLSGRGVIYLWAPTAMYGDFTSLLDEARAKYPVAFIGSPGVMAQSEEELQTDSLLMSLDGFMEYAMVLPVYDDMVKTYIAKTKILRGKINAWKAKTGRSYVFVPTFQVAYDDSRWPGRTTPQMYPTSRSEVEKFALEILRLMKEGVFDILTPFIIWSEVYEGAAVIPSLCLPETQTHPTRFVGCGTERMDLVHKFFNR